MVDRGGTFTDVVSVDDVGNVVVKKVPSDTAVVGELANGALRFGTTVATNALLERSGVKTLLLVTRGFGDLLTIGDQTRPSLFDLDATWPQPLTPQIREIGGRIDCNGEIIQPLDIETSLMAFIADEAFEAVAIVLMNSHRNPCHELALAEAIEAQVPGLFRSLGHKTSPGLGYLARLETTLVDATITPILRAAMERDRIPTDALAIRSDGSLCPAERLRAPDAVLSGPSGGVLAVHAIAEQAGFQSVVGLDMGGTSTDVCRLDVGRLPRRQGDTFVAGVRLRRSMLEVETIAAGGGSILTGDGQRLQVGPESAGAHPGPQCYGRGGPPTLTDAALAEGLIDPMAFSPPLNPALVELPDEPGNYLDIAREAMAQAVRRLATERGVDLHDHALVSYGGAAGQHAAEVASRLGIRTVLIHPCAAVLSAWGQSFASREEQRTLPLWRSIPTHWEAVLKGFRSLEDALPDLGNIRYEIGVRHCGCDHAIAIEVEGPYTLTFETLSAKFEEEHRKRFGFDRPGLGLEVENLCVRVSAPTTPLTDLDDDPWKLGDDVVSGPKRITTETTSIWLPDGWKARRAKGLLWLETETPTKRAMPETRTPYAVELWSNRFQAVAEEAGAVLQRLARSVNIRERRDFSCAIFDGQGYLVANAPHIPVHLGAMGETVRDLIRREPVLPTGQAWLSNDPTSGGSHLPDLTVVTAVESGNSRWFVACRGHHVDVGGLTPGSMPPHSEKLEEEGFVVRCLPLLKNGHLDDIRSHLVGCREVDTVMADIEAQIASNIHAAQRLTKLAPASLIDTWMNHLRDVADEAVAEVISSLRPGRAEDIIAGVPLKMEITPTEDTLKVDLQGTGPAHSGNLNAPQSVVRAAVLFALRVLVGRPIPLNEGCLRRVQIECPAGSIVSPPSTAAVAGGNVETSQRLVDLFFRATGHRASSQGTMNNLTLGGMRDDGALGPEAWSIYETIGGGLGATPHVDGISGRQVHMTNTRATDPEVIEARLPLMLHRFAYRPQSGGDGKFRGGDGLIREFEVTGQTEAALLATRRLHGPPGLNGGSEGAPGRDALFLNGHWVHWNGEARTLPSKARIRVETPGGGGWGKASSE